MNAVLGKEVPDETFPNMNNPEAHKKWIDSLIKSILSRVFTNISVLVVIVYAVAFQVVPWNLSK
jgi:hypothetical protein